MTIKPVWFIPTLLKPGFSLHSYSVLLICFMTHFPQMDRFFSAVLKYVQLWGSAVAS